MDSPEPTPAPPSSGDTHPAAPPAATAVPIRAAAVDLAAATPLTTPDPPQADDLDSGSRTAAPVAFTGPAGEGESSSYLMPLLVLTALGLAGYAGTRLRRRHRRRQLEAVWRRREVTWNAVVRNIEARRAVGALKPDV